MRNDHTQPAVTPCGYVLSVSLLLSRCIRCTSSSDVQQTSIPATDSKHAVPRHNNHVAQQSCWSSPVTLPMKLLAACGPAATHAAGVVMFAADCAT
jgi:hypothetical protein